MKATAPNAIVTPPSAMPTAPARLGDVPAPIAYATRTEVAPLTPTAAMKVKLAIPIAT